MENEKTTFKIELKLEDLKAKVETYLDAEIAKYVKNAEMNTILGENIASIFKTSWSDKRGSELRQMIDDAIENKIRNCVWKALDKTDISKSIEDAIESNLRDGTFIASLARAKTMELLTKKENN